MSKGRDNCLPDGVNPHPQRGVKDQHSHQLKAQRLYLIPCNGPYNSRIHMKRRTCSDSKLQAKVKGQQAHKKHVPAQRIKLITSKSPKTIALVGLDILRSPSTPTRAGCMITLRTRRDRSVLLMGHPRVVNHLWAKQRHFTRDAFEISSCLPSGSCNRVRTCWW